MPLHQGARGAGVRHTSVVEEGFVLLEAELALLGDHSARLACVGEAGVLRLLLLLLLFLEEGHG